MIIQSAQELTAFCERIHTAPTVFVDTEFVGEGRYYPEVGAIQVGTLEEAAIVDPLAIPDLAPLLELLGDPSIEKVFHAATQDLQIFYRMLGRPLPNIFDTQIAAALLGYDEQISFVNLVERTTGTSLQKSHCFTDWLRRPLSPGQIDYALDDVRFLAPVYQRLVEELTERNRLTWAQEEFLRLEELSRFLPVDPYELYLRIRGVERIRGQALAILRELVAWREETAYTKNIPPGRIARDEVLVELARRPRQSVKDLHEIRGMQPQQIERFGAGLLEAVQRGTEAPRPTPRRLAPFSSAMEPTVDFLALCMRSLSSEQSVSAGLIATRSDLVDLVRHGKHADILLMRGWRREAFGDALLATLEGKATARIIPGTRQVHLDWHAEAPGNGEGLGARG